MPPADDDFTERVCRLNGKRPTARERWRAFHRLYRLATRKASAQEYEAVGDCFRVLWANWSMLRLCEAEERQLSRVSWPPIIRRSFLETERKQRLGRYQFPLEHDQHVARIIRDEHGLEMTPDQVAETRQSALAKIRAEAARRGVKLPAGDRELVEWMRQAHRDKEK